MKHDEMKPIDLGTGPAARVEHFSPEEFSPTAKLLQQPYDAAIVAYEDCRLVTSLKGAYAGDGNVATLVCDECVADAGTVGFGGVSTPERRCIGGPE